MPTLPKTRYVTIHVTQNKTTDIDCPRRYSPTPAYYWRTYRGDISALLFMDYASAVVNARSLGYYVSNENRRWNGTNKGN